MGSETRILIKPNSHKNLKSKVVGDRKGGGDISTVRKMIKAHASAGALWDFLGRPFAGK